MKKIVQLLLILPIALIFAGCMQKNTEKDAINLVAALEKLTSEDYQGAISGFTKAIEVNSSDELAYYGRGMANFYLMKYKDAISDFDKAVDIDPSEMYLLNRGNAKRQIKDYNGAIDDYNAALEVNPKKAEVYLNRGYAKVAMNLKYDGRMDFIRAGALDLPEAKEALKKYTD